MQAADTAEELRWCARHLARAKYVNQLEDLITMNELRVTDPLAVNAMDDLFRGMLRPWRADLAKQAPQIKLDLHEDDKAYTVKAEVPGVGKDDIDVHDVPASITIDKRGPTRRPYAV
jgi:HSP20 family molecular chaperone IbpA